MAARLRAGAGADAQPQNPCLEDAQAASALLALCGAGGGVADALNGAGGVERGEGRRHSPEPAEAARGKRRRGGAAQRPRLLPGYRLVATWVGEDGGSFECVVLRRVDPVGRGSRVMLSSEVPGFGPPVQVRAWRRCVPSPARPSAHTTPVQFDEEKDEWRPSTASPMADALMPPPGVRAHHHRRRRRRRRRACAGGEWLPA